jgi:hypothetical protein
MYTPQNLTFGNEGPVMEGTWYNPRTGDSFTVRNSFFEDNQYVVQTTDGRILNYNQIQNYIKSDRPIETPKPMESFEQLPAEVADLVENIDYTDDVMTQVNSLGNLADTYAPIPTQTTTTNAVDNSNYNIVSKALSKRSLPDINIDIVWKDFPLKEMEMLKELMDVSYDDIINWYLDNVDLVYTEKVIKETLKEYITNMVSKPLAAAEPETISRKEPVPEKEPVSKKETKSSKKTKAKKTK